MTTSNTPPAERLAGVINELHGLARSYSPGAVRPPAELTAATLRDLAAQIRDVIEDLGNAVQADQDDPDDPGSDGGINRDAILAKRVEHL